MHARMGRMTRSALRLAAALLVIGHVVMAAAPGSAAPALGRQPLDLPALALRPADLAAIGLEDYRVSNGGWLNADETVSQLVIDYLIDKDEIAPVMQDEGDLVGSYPVLLSQVFTTDDGRYKSTRGLWMTLYEFGSADGAEAGYGFFADHPFAPLTDEVEPLAMPTVGDASFAGQWDGEDMNSGDPMTYVGLGFRTGRIYAEVLFWDIERPGETDEPPTRPEFDAIAEQAQQRIERGLSRQHEAGFGLSTHVARFVGDSPFVTIIGDRYAAIDGEPIHEFDETPAELEERAATMSAKGMVASFRLMLDLAGVGGIAEGDPRIMLFVEQYADADAASAAMRVTYDEYRACGCFDRDVPARSLSELGDEALGMAVTMPFSAEGTPGYFILVRTGDTVSQVWLTSESGPTLDQALMVAEIQTACAVDGCATAVPLPEELAA